ncbi:hypothetical protein ABT097_28185 [Streptomyces sp. NPDC002225]|uniref:hypothetical protein n=1 Tax=Streptomyces sp. NPDC002225 TaxID=3154413 RepID=UPI0033330FD1
MTSHDDIQQLAQQLADHHHPHFQGVTTNSYGRLAFTFATFTGAEPEPDLPREVWEDSRLTQEALRLLEKEFIEARSLWLDAAYVRALSALRPEMVPVWGEYVQARESMNKAFAALDTTADTHWRAAVSTLVAAQERALAAARAWDWQAAALAAVDEKYLYGSSISPAEAHARAGLDTTGWVVESASAYAGYGDSPLMERVNGVVERQRDHVQKVAALTTVPSQG